MKNKNLYQLKDKQQEESYIEMIVEYLSKRYKPYKIGVSWELLDLESNEEVVLYRLGSELQTIFSVKKSIVIKSCLKLVDKERQRLLSNQLKLNFPE
jgi:hypothetical protein